MEEYVYGTTASLIFTFYCMLIHLVWDNWELPFLLINISQVFTTAAHDERKFIVLLAFETIEKIVQDYFPYITETETTTFTDCVNCLIAFTKNRVNNEISVNAINLLQLSAEKLAEGYIGSSLRKKDKETSGKVSTLAKTGRDGKQDTGNMAVDNHGLWFPLLAGKEIVCWMW